MIDNETKLLILKDRYQKLRNRPKCIKCPGVLGKLERQIRNLSDSSNP